MATHSERKAQTRLNIMTAAKKLFDSNGINQTSVEQIYVKANLSKGAFYKHFKTKLDLIIALEKEQAREQSRQVLQQVESGADAIQVLKDYMDVLADWFSEREKTAEAMVMTQLGKPSHSPEHQDPETSSRAFLARVIEHAQKQHRLREDKDPKLLAQILGGTIVAAIINWSHQPQGVNLRQSLQDSLEIFLNGTLQELPPTNP